jgi:hypothetical protein
LAKRRFNLDFSLSVLLNSELKGRNKVVTHRLSFRIQFNLLSAYSAYFIRVICFISTFFSAWSTKLHLLQEATIYSLGIKPVVGFVIGIGHRHVEALLQLKYPEHLFVLRVQQELGFGPFVQSLDLLNKALVDHDLFCLVQLHLCHLVYSS